MTLIDEALQIEPDNLEVLSYKGDWLVKNGSLDEAISYYDRVLNIEPDNVNALSYKGDWLVKNGSLDEAISYYEKGLEIDTFFVDASKKSNYDKILAIDPNNLDAINAKGSSLVSLGRSERGYTIVYIDYLDEAISYFDRVLEKDPNHVGALFNKARALVQLNKTDDGMSYVEKVLEIEPNNVDAITYKGDQLISMGRPEEGIIFINKALELQPNHVDALFNKGIILAKEDNYYDALTVFDQILQIKPENQLAQTNLELAVKKVGYISFDGFLEVTVHDSKERIAAHLKVPNMTVLNHTISSSMIDEWPVTKVINRDGQDYEVRQKKVMMVYHIYSIRGGATHYGIPYQYDNDIWRLHGNYWQYLVAPEDTITFVYSTFRPVV
jgi:tetratricopeptide (TPR) repeat protein